MKKILRKNVFNKDLLRSWAKKVKARDGFKCVACGYKGYLHSHHILPKSKYRQYCYSVMNGITLCYICHLSSNGVHGSDKPRNKTVSKLRKLLKSNISQVKIFLKDTITKK